MPLPQPEPLRMRPAALFAPADGSAYTKEDGARVFAQQPLEGLELPFSYLVPSPSKTLKPPVLRYGWRIGHVKLMEIINTHFPKAVEWRVGPDLFGHETDSDYINAVPDEELDKFQPNTAETMYGDELLAQLCYYVGLPEDSMALFYVQPLYDSDRKPEIGLTIGTNYIGVLDEPYYSKLKALISPNEDAKWYLDFIKWRWRRITPKRKPKRKASSKAT